VIHRYHQISYALTSIHFVNPRFESDILVDLVLCSLMYIRRVRFDNKQSDIRRGRAHQSNRLSLSPSRPLTWRPWLSSSSNFYTEEDRTISDFNANIIDNSPQKIVIRTFYDPSFIISEPLLVTHTNNQFIDPTSQRKTPLHPQRLAALDTK
jgi:hypothetical protein